MFEGKLSEQAVVSSFLSHQSHQPPYVGPEGGLTAVWETIILVLYLLHRLVEASAASATRAGLDPPFPW